MVKWTKWYNDLLANELQLSFPYPVHFCSIRFVVVYVFSVVDVKYLRPCRGNIGWLDSDGIPTGIFSTHWSPTCWHFEEFLLHFFNLRQYKKKVWLLSSYPQIKLNEECQRPTSYRVAVVPTFCLSLLFYLDPKNEAHASPYSLDPTRKGMRNNWKLGTTATLHLVGL